MGWADYFTNARGHHLKKAMYDVLKDRYPENEPIIERLGAVLVTESDMNNFMKLITNVYEAAYLKAVNDHKEQLHKLGLSARIVPTKT